MKRSAMLLLLLTAGCAGVSPLATSAGTPPTALRAELQAVGIDRPEAFEWAIAAGTRTGTGAPGTRYWQNFASYRIRARVTVGAEPRLDATAEIEYRNNSPDTLELLHLELPQNLHAPGAIRFEEVEVTGGMDLRRVSVGGRLLTSAGGGPRYAVFGTRLVVLPPEPVGPGQSVRLAIEYGFLVPQAGAGGRMGYDGDDLLYLAYWYPQMAVYDDVVAWHTDPFVGTTEFYTGFASYDYEIDAPAGWVVVGTGRTTNAGQVLHPSVLERLQLAERSDSVVSVLTPRDFPQRATAGASRGRLVWRLQADSVRDVAFAVVRNVHWDALRAAISDGDGNAGDGDGDGNAGDAATASGNRGDAAATGSREVNRAAARTPGELTVSPARYTRVNAIYRPSAPRWRHAARYGAHAIRFLSAFLSVPYPWSHMSLVEGGGIIGGGMEYPMMSLIGDYNDARDEDLYNVIAHEIAHMWVPMLISTDERRYSWLDEGTTTFNENAARADFFPGRRHWLDDHAQYLALAGSDDEGELMRRSSYHYSGAAFTIASYSKPAAALVALRAVLGDTVFMGGYRDFLRQWRYRHPYPWDLFNAFEAASGRDLGWFWRGWYYETWTLDHAIAGVRAEHDSTRIVIEDRGRLPMPAMLRVRLANGETRIASVPVEHWLAGHRQATVSVATPSPAVHVEIDPEQYLPDVDRGNNVWERQVGGAGEAEPGADADLSDTASRL
ncbi:MAG TPA: M1 family metallopeptidase [Longimicrobiales bacterium]|nr:M1 family metallopeptidase [Longimicrobiales bacterium]